ncbi:MAG: hypothetical protein NC337_15695 [Roseburia sp.]|nr:hypothetical protein [Roseburia sp.]
MLLAVLSAVLFFVSDIRRAWTALYGRSAAARHSPRTARRRRGIGRATRQERGNGRRRDTERLSVQTRAEERTQIIAPEGAEEPASSGANAFELIQDITYTEGAEDTGDSAHFSIRRFRASNLSS